MGIQCTCIITNHCCSSVTRSCLTLCDSMDCSMPGFPVLHHLPEFAQIHVHWVDDAIQSPPSPPSAPALSLSQHQGLFSVSWLFASGGQSIRASASASVLPVNIQGWFPLGLTGLISLPSKGLSLKSLLQHHNSKALILLVIACQLSFNHCVVPSRFVDSKFPWVKHYKRKGMASLCLNKIIFFGM